MRIELQVDPRHATPAGFAVVRLRGDGATDLGQVDVEYSKLAPLRNTAPVPADFLLLASAVYAADKLVGRASADDGWTREFELAVPVSDPDRWNGARESLTECLSFLSGDRWSLEFLPLRSRLARPRRRSGRVPRPAGDAVCLFSGGLDSLAGAIDHLEEHPSERLLLVGHHDGQMAGPFADQRAVLAQLSPAYPNRLSPVLARVGHSAEAHEITLRGRSLIFVALGVFAASALGDGTPLFIPENGTIALNAPLTPSRRGSCSTRTAHPHYLLLLESALTTLGLNHPLRNPLELKTKGEVVVACRNGELLRQLAPLTVSCAKRGHKATWPNRSAESCGRCMPCIYRRAALHAAGLDTERYGADICVGDVDLDDVGLEAPNDLRACFSFLKRSPSVREIGALLIANGRIDATRVADFAGLVHRTMEEIRTLLRDKGNVDIRRRAGIRN